jgi:hypothetical protein
VNSEARRNEAVITVVRVGSSGASSAYVLPPDASVACFSIVSAWEYAVSGPSTASPAK